MSPKDASAKELACGAAEFGVYLSPEQLGAFRAYVDAILFWRTRLSLTTAATAIAIVRGHLLDALAVCRFLEPGKRLADLGSGAGFPGIPLAIACPQSVVVLVESRRRKANFLRDVVRRCGLTNVEVFEGRAEGHPPHWVGTFDLVVSRAVWRGSAFLKISSVLLRSGGLAVAMKGRGERVQEVSDPAFFQPERVRYVLHGGIERVLLAYRKR